MSVAGGLLHGVGILGALGCGARLSELGKLCALLAGAGAWMLWGWMAGAGVAWGDVGTLAFPSWRRYRS